MNDSSPANMVLLQTFYEVARAGSVTVAARQLGRSQPAVSHRLRALERDLGVPLFQKIGRRLQLTEYGRRLRTECLDLMTRSQGIGERVRRTDQGLEGHVTIGTLHTVASHLLVPLLRTFFIQHPRVGLALQFGTVSRLRERLLTGECDVLVIVGDTARHGLDITPVGSLSLAAVMTPEMAPKRRRRISPAMLRRLRYLAFEGEPDPTFDLIEGYAQTHGLEDAYTPRVPHIETLRELAAAGAGYALLPTYAVRRDQESGRVVALRAEGLDSTVPIAVIRRAEQVMTPAFEAVFQALVELRAKLKRLSAGPISAARSR